MPLDSQLVERFDQGLAFDINLENLIFRVYVAQRPADVQEAANIVPAELFASAGNVHVAAIHDTDDAAVEIQNVLFNLDPGDTLVFLCSGPLSYAATLAEFGQGRTAAS